MGFDIGQIGIDLVGGSAVGGGVKLYKWFKAIDTAMGDNPLSRDIYGDKIIKCKKKRVVNNYLVPQRHKDFRDYLSSYILYLPYASSISLNASEIVGKSLSIDCFLDCRTGDVKYTIWIESTIISTVIGRIRVDMPVTRVERGTDLIDLSQGAQSIISSGVTGAISGGVVGGVGSAVFTGAPMLNNFAKPNPCTVNGVYSGGSSIDDPMDIYLIEYVPTIEIDNGIRAKYGKPCNKVDTLGNNTGYIECSEVDIIGLATEEEKAEIKQRLLQGVYI